MANFYTPYTDMRRKDDESARRLLKRLRIALLIWMITFSLVVLWFYIIT